MTTQNNHNKHLVIGLFAGAVAGAVFGALAGSVVLGIVIGIAIGSMSGDLWDRHDRVPSVLHNDSFTADVKHTDT
jgi:uncharacterized membrane protein